MRMNHYVICGLTGSTASFHISRRRYDFLRKRHFTWNTCFHLLYNIYLKGFSLYDEYSDIWSKTSSGLHVKYALFLSDFNENWISLTDLRKILKYQISWKSVYWEPSCFMRTDRRKGGHYEADSRFSKFSERVYKLIRSYAHKRVQKISYTIDLHRNMFRRQSLPPSSGKSTSANQNTPYSCTRNLLNNFMCVLLDQLLDSNLIAMHGTSAHCDNEIWWKCTRRRTQNS